MFTKALGGCVYLSLLCCSLYFSGFIVISLYSSSNSSEKDLFSSGIYSSMSHFALASGTSVIEIVITLLCSAVLQSCDSSSVGCGFEEGPLLASVPAGNSVFANTLLPHPSGEAASLMLTVAPGGSWSCDFLKHTLQPPPPNSLQSRR